MNKKHYIYMHIFPNGKVYIGQCKGNPKQRWGKEGIKYYSQFVYKAIKKYGWKNIEHKILQECETQEQSNYWEKHYIKLYKSNNKKYGYNLTTGGDGVSGYIESEEKKKRRREIFCSNLEWKQKLTFANLNHTEETKQKISKANSGKKRSKEFCELMRNIAKQRCGSKNPFWGKKHTKESIKIIKEKNANKIICIETGQIFYGCREAAEFFNVKRESISKAVNGRIKNCKGYHFIKIKKEN